MVKKAALFLFFLTAVSGPAFADWREEAAQLIGKNQDFKAAAEYLTLKFDSLEELDRKTASGLLAYCHDRLGDKAGSFKWLSEYFETYGWGVAWFDFLDTTTNISVAQYLRRWQAKYPLAMEIALIESRRPEDMGPPAVVVIGIEMANEAYFKFFDEQDILKAGLFKRGYNSISLETPRLFQKTGVRRFRLELKADDLILTKDVDISVQVDIQTQAAPAGTPAANKKQEYILSLFFGNRLLALNKKTVSLDRSIKIPLPPPNERFSPFGPVEPTDRRNPIATSFPIFALPAVIAELIRELRKKDPPEPPIVLQKKREMTIRFKWRNAEGYLAEVRALLRIASKNSSVRPFS